MPECQNSALLAGDIESSLTTSFTHVAGCFWGGIIDISSVLEHTKKLMREAAKHQQKQALYVATCVYHLCSHMLGRDNANVDTGIKSLDELEAIGLENVMYLLSLVRRNPKT
jgi:spore maturation protein SpmA